MKFNENTDFYQGYQLALKNAKDHIAVAMVAKDISFGLANSHLILASEEAIKANMIFLFHFDKDSAVQEIKHVDKYFDSHKYKHEITRSYEAIGALIEKMLDKILGPMIAAKDEDLSVDQILEKRNEGFDDLIEYLDNLDMGKEPLDTDDTWWNQADKDKNRGLYISHLKKQGKWDGPFKITSKQFFKSTKIVTGFVEKVEYMVQMANTPEGRKFYNEMRKKINEQKERE